MSWALVYDALPPSSFVISGRQAYEDRLPNAWCADDETHWRMTTLWEYDLDQSFVLSVYHDYLSHRSIMSDFSEIEAERLKPTHLETKLRLARLGGSIVAGISVLAVLPVLAFAGHRSSSTSATEQGKVSLATTISVEDALSLTQVPSLPLVSGSYLISSSWSTS